jgi:hypothetical protein
VIQNQFLAAHDIPVSALFHRFSSLIKRTNADISNLTFPAEASDRWIAGKALLPPSAMGAIEFGTGRMARSSSGPSCSEFQ